MQQKLLVLGLAGLFSVGIIGCSGGNEAQSEAMLNEDLDCPGNAQSEYAAWGGGGKTGWTHSCKLKHGKYVVWVKGIKIIEGSYNNGLKSGAWIYRNEQGEVTASVNYMDGKKVN